MFYTFTRLYEKEKSHAKSRVQKWTTSSSTPSPRLSTSCAATFLRDSMLGADLRV